MNSQQASEDVNNPLLVTPLTTTAFASICIFIHLIQLAVDFDLQKVTMSPRLVLHTNEYYRIISSAVFHANLMHIGMNMMSLMAIGTLLEKRVGSFYLLLTIAWAILLSGLFYIFIAWLAYAVLGFDEWMYTHAVGFSGVLFHLSVLECNIMSSSGSNSRSLFGVVSVPTSVYPFALLILLQFFIPGLSFLGHLSGIITGTMQYYGVFTTLLFVKESYLREIESSWKALQTLQSTLPNNFCPTPSLSSHFQGGSSSDINQDISSFAYVLKNGIAMIWKFVSDVIDTLIVCVLGRGQSANDNIRFANPLNYSCSRSDNDLRGSSSLGKGGGRVLGTTLDNDDDWSGLPLVASSSSGGRQRDHPRHISRLV